jgi:hypothetical protein
METLIQALVADPDRTNAIAAVANVVVAAIALFVAAISIFLSWHTLLIQKRHNRLSVRPLPFIAVADYEDRLWVKLVNNGSGPLIVKSTNVTGANERNEDIISFMPRMLPNLAWKTFTSGMKDRSIMPGKELFFIDLEGNPLDPEYIAFRDRCREELSALSVTISYTDIYGDKFEPANRQLDWFARNKSKKVDQNI